ncbi:hydrolase [Effusibacillus dendaii]|uniref:Hydrolase n=1 Tax=Effusibacillus dendaii TaxID=2743772 RepID=A0A7I8D8E8_9BACL|nr:hydrolase [Effusibacillus dendaii]
MTAIQQQLRILGYFTYPSNTGYYGELTEGAVKAFQKDNGIEVTGKVGPTTAKILADVAAKNEANWKQSNAAKSSQLIDTAESLIGTPYAWGGTSPSGFDCSGFVNYVFKNTKGIQLGRTTGDMYSEGTPVTDLQPGDLVFFATYSSGPSHVGIYVGDNQFISSTDSYGVKIDSLSNSYWGPRYLGAKRIG